MKTVLKITIKDYKQKYILLVNRKYSGSGSFENVLNEAEKIIKSYKIDDVCVACGRAYTPEGDIICSNCKRDIK